MTMEAAKEANDDCNGEGTSARENNEREGKEKERVDGGGVGCVETTGDGCSGKGCRGEGIGASENEERGREGKEKG